MIEHACVKIAPKLYFSFLIDDGEIVGSGFLKKQAKETVTSAYTKKVRNEVIRYLKGEPTNLQQFKTKQKMTQFEDKVFSTLKKIPFGNTVTYGELASKIGNPKSSRAVGNVLGKNKIPLFVPCHRVVGSVGIGGFMKGIEGGVEIKKRLLELENINPRHSRRGH